MMIDVKNLTREELAYMLSVSPSCVTQWRDNQGLPFKKKGARISYDAHAVHEWYIAREFVKLGRKPPATVTVSCLDDVERYIRENFPLVKLVNK